MIFILQKGSERCGKLPMSLGWSPDLSPGHSEAIPLLSVIWSGGPLLPGLQMAGRNWSLERRKPPAGSHPEPRLSVGFLFTVNICMFPKPVN